MDKLERYLDQVCRSMGGPRPLRQHVRQELREHLLDAIAQHKAAGATDETALDRALEEFGKPDDVRSELEWAHGQRKMLAVVIDKTMEWKEMTMKSKWLWMTWANLALALVIALEALFITFTVLFIVPKFQKLMMDGLLDRATMDEHGVRWLMSFLLTVNHVVGRHTLLTIVIPAAAWGVFEWRVRSENKAFMRLSILGTAAASLTMVVILMTAALMISFCLGVPATGRIVRPFAVEQLDRVEQSLGALEQAAAKMNWDAMPAEAEKMGQAFHNIADLGPVIPALVKWNETPTADALRAHVQTAINDFAKVQLAIRNKDAGALDAALRDVRKAYEPVRDAAKKSAR
jgi:hypothetical protein